MPEVDRDAERALQTATAAHTPSPTSNSNQEQAINDTKRAQISSDIMDGRKVRSHRFAAYGILLLFIASTCVAALLSYNFSPSAGRAFYFKDGELERGVEGRPLNPILDIKLRILADYPVEKLSRARDTNIQQVNDPETLRAVYYNLFLLSDWTEIKRLLTLVGGNKSLGLQVHSTHIGSIMELLDSTILAAAYLYERLGMKEEAIYFYSGYLEEWA